MGNQNNDEIEIDLLELFNVLRQRMVSILMTGIILATVAGLGTMFLIQPKYQSTSQMYIIGENSGISSLADLQVGTYLGSDYILLVESRPVIEKVIENLGLDMEYEELLSIMTVEQPDDSRIIKITVTTSDPYMAKEIVDEICEVAISRIVAIMGTEEPTVFEYGHLESQPCSPSIKKNVAIGGLLGIFISVAIFVITYLLNDTIRTEEDVEKYLQLNNLALIPIEEGAIEQMIRDRRKRNGQGIGNITNHFKKKKNKRK